MAFSETLFLKVVFIRPLHPSDLEGPEAKVTPKPEMGLRTTNSQDRSKEDTDFPLTQSTQYVL